MKFDFTADATVMAGPGSRSKTSILAAVVALGTAAEFVTPVERFSRASPYPFPGSRDVMAVQAPQPEVSAPRF